MLFLEEDRAGLNEGSSGVVDLGMFCSGGRCTGSSKSKDLPVVSAMLSELIGGSLNGAGLARPLLAVLSRRLDDGYAPNGSAVMLSVYTVASEEAVVQLAWSSHFAVPGWMTLAHLEISWAWIP